MRRALTLACVTAAVVGVPTTATAAPPAQEVIPLECSDGSTFVVVVNGNGEWTPGRLVDSTGVFVPIGFSDFFFLVDGVPVEPEPGEDVGPSDKGGGNVAAHNPRPILSCDFEITEVLEEPDGEFPAGTEFTFGGTVTGFLTGG